VTEERPKLEPEIDARQTRHRFLTELPTVMNLHQGAASGRAPSTSITYFFTRPMTTFEIVRTSPAQSQSHRLDVQHRKTTLRYNHMPISCGDQFQLGA